MEEKSTSKLMEILKHTKKTELAALQEDVYKRQAFPQVLPAAGR